jgi:2,3-bisphosphoglycerate-independent phosphoglycerate mutase
LKSVLLILHGAADAPLTDLDGKTPLEAARTPRLDDMARRGRVGAVWTLPADGEPRTELALLGLLGYPFGEVDTPGAGGIEAAGIELDLNRSDLAFRTQFVHTDAERLLDPAPREMPVAVERELLETVARRLNGRRLQLYPGSGRTHVLVWRDGPDDLICLSPFGQAPGSRQPAAGSRSSETSFPAARGRSGCGSGCSIRTRSSPTTASTAVGWMRG